MKHEANTKAERPNNHKSVDSKPNSFQKTIKDLAVVTTAAIAIAIAGMETMRMTGADKKIATALVQDPEFEANRLLAEIDEKVTQLEKNVSNDLDNDPEKLDLKKIFSNRDKSILLHRLFHLIGDYESNIKNNNTSSLKLWERVLLQPDKEKMSGSLDEGLTDMVQPGSLKKIALAISPEERKKIRAHGMARVLEIMKKIETTRLRKVESME